MENYLLTYWIIANEHSHRVSRIHLNLINHLNPLLISLTSVKRTTWTTVVLLSFSVGR